MALAVVSSALLAFGWIVGDSVGRPWAGLAVGLSAIVGILIFLGDDE